MKKREFFKKREVAFIFSIVAILSGFFFLNPNITGNVILSEENPMNIISIIGGLLIFSAIILAVYSFRKR